MQDCMGVPVCLRAKGKRAYCVCYLAMRDFVNACVCVHTKDAVSSQRNEQELYGSQAHTTAKQVLKIETYFKRKLQQMLLLE